jgi:membrane-associated phospholipid phosphatase
LKRFILDNKIFLILYLLFLIVGFVLIQKYEHGHEILLFNALHTPFFDQLFKYTTQMAEAPMLLLIVIVAVRFSYGKGVLLGLNALLVFGVTALLKNVAFGDQVRPSVFFEGKEQLNFVQGVEIYRYHSFPSGHTSSAFALFFLMSILIKDKKWAPLFFTLALMVGVSRVYLLEHFFRDVYVGSAVGVLCTSAFYLIFANSRFYNNLTWKDKALWP